MQDKIKRILERELTVQAVSLVDISTETFFSIEGIPAAAQAIAEIVAAQPVRAVGEILKDFQAQMGLHHEYNREACRDKRYLLVNEQGIYVRWGRLERDINTAMAAQPVARARAMAALTILIPTTTNRSLVYRVAGLAEVWDGGHELTCVQCCAHDCDHARAVELYRAKQGESDG